MSTAIEAFNPQILYFPPLLEQFFKGDEAIHAIRTHRDQPLLQLRAESGCIPVELQAICKECSACAWRILSLIAYCVSATHLYRRCVVRAVHAQSQAEIMRCEQIFKSHFLCASINTYQKSQEDIYLQPTIDSPWLGQRYGFFDYDGLCRGMSNWFLYLYFQTRRDFNDPVVHMSLITQQFSEGTPREAALLQLLNPAIEPAKRFLSLQFTEPYKRLCTAGLSQARIASEFNALPAGAYTIFSSSHQFNYIKVDNNLSFVYNPTYGCFMIDGTVRLEQVLPMCLWSHDYSRELWIDRVEAPDCD